MIYWLFKDDSCNFKTNKAIFLLNISIFFIEECSFHCLFLIQQLFKVYENNIRGCELVIRKIRNRGSDPFPHYDPWWMEEIHQNTISGWGLDENHQNTISGWGFDEIHQNTICGWGLDEIHQNAILMLFGWNSSKYRQWMGSWWNSSKYHPDGTLMMIIYRKFI